MQEGHEEEVWVIDTVPRGWLASAHRPPKTQFPASIWTPVALEAWFLRNERLITRAAVGMVVLGSVSSALYLWRLNSSSRRLERRQPVEVTKANLFISILTKVEDRRLGRLVIVSAPLVVAVVGFLLVGVKRWRSNVASEHRFVSTQVIAAEDRRPALQWPHKDHNWCEIDLQAQLPPKNKPDKLGKGTFGTGIRVP